MPLLFVYGTLKRGCKNHRQLAGQTFLAEARTGPGYRLHDLGDFPCLVPHPDDTQGVKGELWRVDEAALERLDVFEGVNHGLYSRESVELAEPSSEPVAESYLYQLDITGRAEIVGDWRE